MTVSFSRRVRRLALGAAGLLAPWAASGACQLDALMQAWLQAPVRPAVQAAAAVDARRPSPAELAGLPELQRIEAQLRTVGVALAWHQLQARALPAALEQAGGPLVLAGRTDAGELRCELWAGDGAAPGLSVAAAAPAVWALLPPAVGDGPGSGSVVSVQAQLRGLAADFQQAMRVGAMYAPAGAWVVSPWVSAASLSRSMAVDSPMPGLQGRADSRVQSTVLGLGLTRGLTRDTAVSLLLLQQRSRTDTVVAFPALGFLPAQQTRLASRQDDTSLGLGVYSVLVRAEAATPAVLLDVRAQAPSAHVRAGGRAAVTALQSLGGGWALAASLGADAERPQAAPSRQARFATLGASASLSPGWTATFDAGQRELREQGGSQAQPVHRLRLYRSLDAAAYLAWVVEREGPDQRLTVTFARSW